ncbi:hypothetical protein [Flavisphingomonas formosensis]|uniref:hypothetical protein n=1 Tax=Flavisphingomonas formosensis TaxID=861534 RepID=UPI0012F98EF0|nr:hypothetical protein [Sphingomonas formosensis]
MDLDTLLLHYFGSDDPETLDEATLATGKERLAIDFGVEQEPGRRFALWTLMETFGIAPPPAEAFDEPRLRRAAEDYLSAAWRMERD